MARITEQLDMNGAERKEFGLTSGFLVLVAR